MDKDELQEIYEGLLSRFPPESSAGHALMFVNQVLTAQTDEGKAQALCLLIDLLATTKTPLPFYLAKLWAYTRTDEGIAFFEALADKQDCSE